MFICPELLYIQMQKTGCSHITSLLKRLFQGRQIGKHTAASPRQIAAAPLRLSSIRSPWTWYVSLWTFGVQGDGALRHRLTSRSLQRSLRDCLRRPAIVPRTLLTEARRDVAAWRSVYRDADDIVAFRTWLRMMLDPANAAFLGEGYGELAVVPPCGYMTHRYLSLCCRSPRHLERPGRIASFAALEEFERERCYIDVFIRQESLEETFCEAVGRVRPLTAAERTLIFSGKQTNTSRRTRPVCDYYDDELLALVGERDRLIVEKFGYRAPARAAA